VTDADRIAREKDVDVLRKMALLLVRENERLVAKFVELQKKLLAAEGKDAEQLRLEIAILETELAAARGRMLAHASEKRSRPDEGEQKKGRGPEKGHGPRAQPTLPIAELFHDLDEADKMCPSCGGELDEWEGQFEESDEVDVIERSFRIIRHKRKKYRCKCGACVETAPGPRRVIAGGRYSGAFAISVVVGKYVDHLPLERQVRMMARQGLICDSQTLFDQCWGLVQLLRPAYVRLGEVQRGEPLVFADETPWPHYSAKGEIAAASKWHIWELATPKGVYLEIHGGRDEKAGESLLGGYSGDVMCDGYGVYTALAKKYPDLRLVQCWAHVRRKFVECSTAFPKETERILGLIGQLYEIEQRGRELEPAERLPLRNEESRPVLVELQRVVMEIHYTPGSSLEDAVQYMANRWTLLTRFLETAHVPLDNNLAERSLRGPVVGRKNHYGSRSLRGTEVAAICYSLLESAKLVGLNPEEYLRIATAAALEGLTIPLPHEVVEQRRAAAVR
jgi:transposase